MKAVFPWTIIIVLLGIMTYDYFHKPVDNSAALSAENDSLRRSNVTLHGIVLMDSLAYTHLDSEMAVVLADTTRIKIKYVKIRDNHAALPPDSAVLLFLSRTR